MFDPNRVPGLPGCLLGTSIATKPLTNAFYIQSPRLQI